MEAAERQRPGRARKVAARFADATGADRRQARNARLDALEADAAGADPGPGSDDEFVLEEEEAELLGLGPPGGSAKRKGGATLVPGGKRKTRAQLEAEAARGGPATFAALLEDAEAGPHRNAARRYLAAALGPPAGAAPRKWCAVCGFAAPYCCPKCGARYCGRKCLAVHTDTRCLKFVN